MKRLFVALAIGYVVLGLVTRAKEASGALTCMCDDDCWCKTPGLSLFRWVFPRGHKIPPLAVWKAEREPG